MVEAIATLITVLCGILAIIIAACTMQAPYSKTVNNVLRTLFIISTISGGIAISSIKQLAKLVDASDLNSDDYYNRAGSIPALSTFINLKTIIMRAKKSIRAWVARDSSGRLFLYRNKPRKSTDEWLSTSVHVCGIPSDAFPSIKWKDNEPTRVCIRIA